MSDRRALARFAAAGLALVMAAVGMVVLAPPAGAVEARPGAQAELQAVANVALKPVVAANPANDFATKDVTTIVMTGQDLPVAERDDIGVYTSNFVQVVSSAGWRAGVLDCSWTCPIIRAKSCKVVIGLSTPTELVVAVGNMGATCFDHVNAGEEITVTLFNGSGSRVDGATAKATAVARSGAMPAVSLVSPPSGPETGGNPEDPATNGVVVTASGTTAPMAFWFGGYQIGGGWYGVASTTITPKGGGQFTVVPPAFQSGKKGVQNYGVAVFAVDPENGISSEQCTVLIAGCDDAYLYMRHSKAPPLTLSASDLTLAEKTWDMPGGPPSPACGLATGAGSGGSVSVGVTVTGDATVAAETDVSFSNLNIPQAIVGKATLTVTEPIVVTATLKATVTGCLAIPFPALSIPNVVGVYFVVGGELAGEIKVSITIAKGTYTFTGGWLPGVAGRADTGGIGKMVVNCVDASGNPTQACITTKVDAGVSGKLTVTPVWLQLGPSNGPIQANVGAGLTAAGYIGANVSIPPWPPSPTFEWDVCVAARWAAQVSIPSISFSKTFGGNFLGPFNIAGQGERCPLGATSGAAVPASPTDSTVAAAPGSVSAGASATVTVTLKDAGGKPVLGKEVSLAQDGKQAVISAPSGLSDANGVVTFMVTDAIAETVTFTARNVTDATAVAQTTTVEFAGGAAPAAASAVSAAVTAAAGVVSAAASTLTAGPGSVPANGITTATVTVTLRDDAGAPVPGATVSLAAAGGSSVVSAPSGLSDASGVVTFTVADADVERVVYTATAAGVVIRQTANVTFAPVTVSALESRVDASPNVVTADGTSTATVTVTLSDSGGVPVSGKTVSLTADTGTSVISAPSGPSDANGVVTFTVKGRDLDFISYTARNVTDGVVLTQQDQIEFVAGPPSPTASTVVADPGPIPANGVTDSLVTVTLKDAFGHPVADRTVTLRADGGQPVVSEADGPSDDNGIVTFTVTDTAVETVTFTAIDVTDAPAPQLVLAQRPAVAFEPVTTSAWESFVEAGADEVLNDGVQTSVITVTLLDEGEEPRVGKVVTLTAEVVTLTPGGVTLTPGVVTSSVVSAASGPSDENGVVTFVVTNTKAEQVAYTARSESDGVTLTEKAFVAFLPASARVQGSTSTITATPDTVPNDGVTASTITVTMRNSAGDPVAGRSVALAQDAGKSSAISAASGLSDANGVVTFTVTDTVAELVVYSATDTASGVTLDATVSVAFGVTRTELTSMQPARLLDTRVGSGTVDGRFSGDGIRPAGSVIELEVTGRAGVPASAGAVVLNVTVTEPGGPGFVTVFPCGTARPNASNLNYVAGETIPNAVVVKVGAGGAVCLFTLASTHLVVDVNGFFPYGSSFQSRAPSRLMDSRPGTSTADGKASGAGILAAGSVTELQVTGRAGVPASAGAVVLNVTVTEPGDAGFVTVFPCGSARPNASNPNYVRGQTIANAVVAKLGTDGKVCLFTLSATHLVVDANGYFPSGSAYRSLDPARVLDTRVGFATIDGGFAGGGRRAAGEVTELPVTGRAGVPTGVGAVVLNVTVTEAGGPGFVTVYPCGSPRPNASNLNFIAAQTIPNAVVARVGNDGKVCLFTSGATHLVVDVDGYFP